VWPAASQTRTPVGTGITRAAPPYPSGDGRLSALA
jgi:hypothetical protein